MSTVVTVRYSQTRVPRRRNCGLHLSGDRPSAPRMAGFQPHGAGSSDASSIAKLAAVLIAASGWTVSAPAIVGGGTVDVVAEAVSVVAVSGMPAGQVTTVVGAGAVVDVVV